MNCRPKRDGNREWRRLHNEKFHNLYRSPNIVRVIKCRGLRWVNHVARIEEAGSAFEIFTGKLKKKPDKINFNILFYLKEKGL